MVSQRQLLSDDDADFTCIELITRYFNAEDWALGREQIGGSRLSARKAFVRGY